MTLFLQLNLVKSNKGYTFVSHKTGDSVLNTKDMTNTIFQTDIQINDNNHKLISVGFYYKNDSRKGFGSVLTSPNGKPLDISLHQQSFKKQLGLIKQGVHPDFKTTDEWANCLVNQLDNMLPHYYKECGYKDGLQPLHPSDTNTDDELIQMLHSIIVDNIYVLTQLGALVNDEYNGISYHYEKKMTDKELLSMLQKMGV